MLAYPEKIVAQGEVVPGAASVRLLSESIGAHRVWLGSATTSDPKAGVNTSRILVGNGASKLTFANQPADADTLTLTDGINAAVVYEFDTAVIASGSVLLTNPPADGNTVVIGDGRTTVIFEFDTAHVATGTIALGAVPTDGECVTIKDGTHTITFEFDSDFSYQHGNTRVAIGVTAAATITNLIAAITASALTITAVVDGGDPTVANLTAPGPGTAYNLALYKSGAWNPNPLVLADVSNVTVVGMTGGTAIAVTAPHTVVWIGETATTTSAILALIAAIQASALRLICAKNAGADQADLTAPTYGTSYNVAITRVGANITVSGMSSGTNISVTSPRTAVRVGTNLAATITNLIAAITAQQTMIVAANPSAGIVTLYNLTTIAKSCNNLTITAAPNAREER